MLFYIIDMLKKIKIINLAIIDELEIEFNSSFNVVTGESGAGKTIIYKSINYLFGKKFNKEDIRRNEPRTEISGQVEINSKSYQISRAFTPTTSKNFINEKSVNNEEYLAFIGSVWESYGQHEQQLLLNQKNHIKYMDLFSAAHKEIYEYRNLYKEFLVINEKIEKILVQNDDYSNNKELYDFQMGELEDIDFEIGDDNILKTKIDALDKNKSISDYFQKLANLDSSTSKFIYLLNDVKNNLDDAAKDSENIKNICNRINDIEHEISDLQYEALKLSTQFSFNISEFDNLKNKLSKISHLKRKYGGTIETVFQYKKKLEEKNKSFLDSDIVLKDMINQRNEIKRKAFEAATKLLDIRKKSSIELESNVKSDLSLMEMNGVDFSIYLGDVELNEDGVNECIFNIRTNKGESIKSIGKIVSGGELSRIMMAIKLSINTSSKNKIFILDEIDAGLSGKEADSIGNIIKRLSRNNQVICITHLSQIASKAEQHYKISKTIINNRTLCNVELLNRNNKIKELAMMISGKEITSQSVNYAKQILDPN